MPTALALTRQNLPQLEETDVSKAMLGGYILRGSEKPDVILMASGSEVELAMKAADALEEKGKKVRVVSMPCTDIFDRQSAEYKESVLPGSVRARVAIEAGCAMSWYKYIGLDGETVTVDHFGASAPAGVLFKEFGFTVENVVAAAERAMSK